MPDPHPHDVEMALTDALRAACALLSLQSPSLLAFDTPRVEGHVRTIDGIERTPCDTQRRERLDPVSPQSLRPLVQSVFRPWQRGKGLAPMALLDSHSVLALDGTGSCASKTRQGASCLHTVQRHGSLTSSPQMLGAAMIHPDFRAVMPLMPEPIMGHDGTGQNDGARPAAQRCMARLRHDHPPLPCLVTEDSRRAHAPHMQTLHDHQRHYLLGVQAGDHASVFQHVQAADHAGPVT